MTLREQILQQIIALRSAQFLGEGQEIDDRVFELIRSIGLPAPRHYPLITNTSAIAEGTTAAMSYSGNDGAHMWWAYSATPPHEGGELECIELLYQTHFAIPQLNRTGNRQQWKQQQHKHQERVRSIQEFMECDLRTYHGQVSLIPPEVRPWIHDHRLIATRESGPVTGMR